ncbi:MAG: alpha/beta hydrolase family protein [Parachlamydiales bacterium]
MKFLLLLFLPCLAFAAQRPSHDQVIKGKIHFAYSLPEAVPKGGAPCLVVLNGLETGQDALKLVKDPDPYALIAYEYPPLVQQMWSPKALQYPYATRKAILGVPQQILEVVRWVMAQPWWDGQPVSLMGLSFGATFIPAVFHLALKEGIALGPSVIAFGGADIEALFRANLPQDGIPPEPAAALFAWLLRPLEPSLHTPYMKGEFLIIYGTKDQRIPVKNAQELADQIPEPKTIVALPVDHLDPDMPEPLGETVRISKRWLDQKRIERKSLNSSSFK